MDPNRAPKNFFQKDPESRNDAGRSKELGARSSDQTETTSYRLPSSTSRRSVGKVK